MTIRLNPEQARVVATQVHAGLENGLDSGTRDRVAAAVEQRGASYLVRVFGRLPVDQRTGRLAVSLRDVLTLGALLDLEDELRRPVSDYELTR